MSRSAARRVVLPLGNIQLEKYRRRRRNRCPGG